MVNDSIPEEIDYYFCIAGKSFPYEFVNSWSETLCYLKNINANFIWSMHYTAIVSETRNNLLSCYMSQNEEAQSRRILFDGKVRPRKVIFLDDDVTWKLEDMIKILE